MIEVTTVDGSVYELEKGAHISLLDGGGLMVTNSDHGRLAVFAKGSWAAAVQVSA